MSAAYKYKSKSTSDAYSLIDHVWSRAQKATDHSWTRLNEAMWNAVTLAISAGLTFRPGDFKDIYDNMRGNFWFGDHEGLYATAVKYGNRSACVAYERWRGRPPFVFGSQRLHVGRAECFPDEPNLRLVVTSFSDDGASIVCCAYEYEDFVRKVTRRKTITIEQLRAMERERRKSKPANTWRRAPGRPPAASATIGASQPEEP